MVRRYGKQHTALPRHFVLQLAPELAPALVENRTIQPSLLFDLSAGLLAIAPGRPGQVAYLQVLNADERVVLADRRCGLMQEVIPGVCNIFG